MNIITGYRGEPHITGQQDRDINMSVFGSGLYILNIGEKLAATIISANEIQIADGLMIADGCAAEVARGTTESMAIENGAQGMRRIDLIVARYTRDAGTGVEDMQLAVITGTPAASSPAVPAYTSGSIETGDTLAEFPLYRVTLDGITIESVTRIPGIMVVAKQSDVTAINNMIGSVTMGTTAATITGAIKELLTKVTNNITNIANAVNRIVTLETKTQGIVGTRHYNVNAGDKIYVTMSHQLSMYMVIVNAASTSNTTRGIYLIGVGTSNALGIKTISAANDVALVDCGTIGGTAGVLRITNNNSGVTLRVTVITTYGTAV